MIFASRILLISLVVFFGFTSNSQVMRSLTVRDTLRIASRSGGEIDSLDLYLFPNLTNLPGGYSGYQLSLPSTLFFDLHNGRFDGQKKYSSPLKFSALPHVGFAYSFGSKGTQTVKVRYEQVFGKRTFLNLDFNQLRSNSFLRNGVYALNEFEAKLNHTRKKFIFHLNADYQKAIKSQNGGLVSDSLLDQFALEFLNTSKSAESQSKKLKINTISLISFVNDSLQPIGLFVENGLSIKNWKYKEGGNLSDIYQVIYFDSTETSDHFQQSTLSNGAGFFLFKKNSQLKAGVHADYWKVFNLSRLFDTTEVRFTGEWNARLKNLETHLYYENRFIGADFGQTAEASLSRQFNRLKFNISTHFSDQLPDPFLRYNLSNTYSPIASWEKEKRLKILAGFQFNIKRSSNLSLRYIHQQLKDNYFYVNGNWSNASNYNSIIHQVNVSGDISLGNFKILPSYQFTYTSWEFSPFPMHRFDTRIVVKGFIFKAKKLKAYSGVDIQLQSSFDAATYVPMLDAFSLNNQNIQNPGLANIHAFGGFQIEQFRFFLRLENIGYFWNDRKNQLAIGYPLVPFQFRVGITWDFFN